MRFRNRGLRRSFLIQQVLHMIMATKRLDGFGKGTVRHGI